MTKRIEGDFDYIVVGAGTAGCIVANRLSADAGNRVLVLEAGGSDNWIWFHIPVGYLFAIGNPRSDWMFRTEPEAGLNGRSLAYPRGKVIGGSSAINAMISMRGQAADYDHWRQLGLTGWGYDDVLPAFRRLEDHFLGEQRASRQRRRLADRGGAIVLGHSGRGRRGRRGNGHPEDSGFQHRRQRGRRLFPRQPEARPPLVVGARLPQAGAGASQSAAREERAGRPPDRRAGPRRRRALHSGRRSRRGPQPRAK